MSEVSKEYLSSVDAEKYNNYVHRLRYYYEYRLVHDNLRFIFELNLSYLISC